MHEILVGRDESDLKKHGSKGMGIIGKHVVGEKGEAHLTSSVRMDLSRPHIVGLFGKRGQGKSYSMGDIAEELQLLPNDIKKNMATVIVDTMGIFWSMKNPNDRDFDLLSKWNMKPQVFDVEVLVPVGQTKEFQKDNIPFDGTFSFRPSDLSAEDWGLTFSLDMDSEMGILMAKAVKRLKEQKETYSLRDIVAAIKAEKAEDVVKEGLMNRFIVAEDWGVFSEEGTSVYDIVRSGSCIVIDVSKFALAGGGGWSVKSLVCGLFARRILEERMKARRLEEAETMGGGVGGIGAQLPITWMLIDEAHQFLPAEGVTASTGPLLQWVKIGREPGVSLVLATQMPNKLHQEALSQCDLVISHRLTSKPDIDSLKNVMQTYLKYNLQEYIDRLPRVKGAAIVLDDNSEKLYPIRMRPRMSWHAGGSTTALKE